MEQEGFFTSFLRSCWTVVVPLLAVMILAVTLFLSGHQSAGVLVGNLGPVMVMIGNLIYIAAWRSRRRWPEAGWFRRLTYVLTMKR